MRTKKRKKKYERYYLRNKKSGKLLERLDGSRVFYSSRSEASKAAGPDYKVDGMIPTIGPR